MGMVGLFVGPVLMALLVAIWREWVLTTEAEILDETMRENSEAEITITSAPVAPSAAAVWSSAEPREMPGPPRLAEPISGTPTRSSRARIPRFRHLSRKVGLPLI